MSSSSSSSSSLRSHLECPICMVIPHGTNIYVCMQGHDICSRCYDQLSAPKGGKKSCPQGRCRYAEPILRNRTVENIIEGSNFELGCEHADEGCRFSGAFRAVRAHEADCPFGQLLPCPESGPSCGLRLQVKEMVAHLRAQHANVVFDVAGLKDASMQKWLMKTETHLRGGMSGGAATLASSTSWNMVVSRLHGAYFAIRFLRRGDTWFSWMTFFGEDEDKYACKISVVKNDRDSKYSFEGRVPSIRTPADAVMENGACLTLTRDMLLKCISAGQISEASRKAGFDAQLSVEYEVRKVSKRRGSSSLAGGASAGRVNPKAKLVGGRR